MVTPLPNLDEAIRKLKDLTDNELHMLNQCIIDTMRNRARQAAWNFNNGDRVSFTDHKSGITWEGRVTAIKTKNISVSCDKPYSKNWLVNANLLKRI